MEQGIGVRALRDGFTRHLARVRRGARLLITDRGTPVAVLDAIHLSAALWLRAELGRRIEFWASDERLEAAAKRERFTVVNPEAVSGRFGPR